MVVLFFLQRKSLGKAIFLVYYSIHIQSPVRFVLQIQVSIYLRRCPLLLTFTKICMVCSLRAFLKMTQDINGTDKYKRMQNSSLNKLLLLHYLLIETVANSLKSRSIPLNSSSSIWKHLWKFCTKWICKRHKTHSWWPPWSHIFMGRFMALLFCFHILQFSVRIFFSAFCHFPSRNSYAVSIFKR